MLMQGTLGFQLLIFHSLHTSIGIFISMIPTRVTASLSPEPACNAMQEFVPAIELLELGYPVSSPSVVEPAGDLVSVPASDFGPSLV